MKKLIIAAAALSALPVIAADAICLPLLETPAWILRDAGKTIYIFEAVRLA